MVAKVSGLGQQCLFAYSGVRVPALHYRELRKAPLFYLIYLWPCQRLGVGRWMSGFGRTSTPTLGGGSYDSLPFCFSLIYLCQRCQEPLWEDWQGECYASGGFYHIFSPRSS
nr:MAG TPA: hypothetical protein [Caudoviricetes sp.]